MFTLSHYGGYHLSQWELSVLGGAGIVDPRGIVQLAT
jgi:hypothetical protein